MDVFLKLQGSAQHSSEEKRKEDEEKRQGWDATLTQARMQTGKWSLLSFTLNTEIDAGTKEGESLRNNLKIVWDLNSTKDNMEKFLGPSLVKRITDLIVMGSKGAGTQKPAKRKAAAQQPRVASKAPKKRE